MLFEPPQDLSCRIDSLRLGSEEFALTEQRMRVVVVWPWYLHLSSLWPAKYDSSPSDKFSRALAVGWSFTEIAHDPSNRMSAYHPQNRSSGDAESHRTHYYVQLKQ